MKRRTLWMWCLGLVVAALPSVGWSMSDRARADVAASWLQVLRSRMELYQVQHGGDYPDLVGAGWYPLTRKTDASGAVGVGEYGPYLDRERMVNPYTGGARVAADASGDWWFDRSTGEIRLVVPMALGEVGLPGGDVVRVDRAVGSAGGLAA